MAQMTPLQSILVPLCFFLFAVFAIQQRAASLPGLSYEEPPLHAWQASNSGLADVLDARGDEFARCRARAPVGEDLELTLVVDASRGYGRVSEVRLPGTMSSNARLSRCLLAVFDGVVFQSPEGGRAELSSRVQ